MMGSSMIVIETTRLILRHPVMDDLGDYFALYSDPEITRYIPDAPRNLEETREEVEWHLNGHPRHPELGLWATVHKPTGRFIGRCGLLPWTIDEVDEVEVAYTIARDLWGQGLATEAARAIRDYAFERLGLSRLVSLIEPENIASQRVAAKMGMAFERQVDDGEYPPYWIYSMKRPAGISGNGA
jgi:ribosomal-protein-alanine N-acetyltransferase